jgi:hypothetical protein
MLELLVSVGLLGLVLGSVAMVSKTSQGVYRQSSQASALEARARQTIDRVVDVLSTMVRAMTFPDPVAPGWTDTLDFQQATGVVGGALTWGPPLRLVLEPDDGEVADGLDNDGDGQVDEGRLVLVREPGTATERRTVLCRGVRGLAEREVANGADDNGNGMVDEPGFCLQRRGDVLRVLLTLEDLDDTGRSIVCSVTTSLRIRN